MEASGWIRESSRGFYSDAVKNEASYDVDVKNWSNWRLGLVAY